MFEWFKRRFGSRATYSQLVRLVSGDDGTAERLIRYELKRRPGLSRDQAIRAAIDRLVHERMR